MGNNLRSVVCITGTRRISRVLRKIIFSNRPENVWCNTFLQPLGCTSYVPTVAVEHKLVNDVVVVMAGQYILTSCG